MDKIYFPSNCKELISNRYQIKELIASGSMGEVFLADDLLLGGVPVAIKFISHVVYNWEQHQEFANEARICAGLSQRTIHIVKVLDYGVCNAGKPFYVMEYLEGKNLSDLMPFSVEKFVNIARQICLGLQSAHEGIDIDGQVYPLVHRDIKPANILVTSDLLLGDLVKILDFGIAKFLHPSRNQNNNGFQGTLAYCSPEQLEESELDHRSDIYSLGVLMYEMLTGTKPWQPETDYFGAWYKAHRFEAPRQITSVNPYLKLPQDLNNLIMACLAKKPCSRPQSLAEVIEVLESIKAKKQPSLCSSTPRNPASNLSLSVEQACWKLTWAKNKPIQEIVFPHLVTTETETVAALSLMMPKSEIQSSKLATRYNQFVFVTAPYPMLLWVTLLYNQEQVAKWLPCYLNMQNPHHLNLVRSLADSDRYPLIFFTLESPHPCIEVSSSRIGLRQQQMLKTWLQQTDILPSVPVSAMELSKKLLKQHYKLLQTRILKQLTSNSNYQTESLTPNF